MAKMKIYSYKQCSTCKKALKYLDERSLGYQEIPIVETPPTLSELKQMLVYLKERGQKINALFNTSGELYRSMGMSQKLKEMSESEALKLLASHGKLIKRPFVLSDKLGVVGFKQDQWDDLF